MPTFTETEQRILKAISDGRPHPNRELCKVIDELADTRTLSVHVASIRKKLEDVGETIVCQYIRGIYYTRHVRLLHSANDGRT